MPVFPTTHLTRNLCARVQASLRRNQSIPTRLSLQHSRAPSFLAEPWVFLLSRPAFTHFVHTELCVMGFSRTNILNHD